MKRAITIACVSLLSGCATQYIAPTSGPVASIQYKNYSHQSLRISFYKVSKGCNGRLVNQFIPPGGSATYTVAAGKNLTFEYYLTDRGHYAEFYCMENLRFEPKANGEYLFKTIDSANKCVWKMIDVTDMDNPEYVRLQDVGWHRGFTDAASWCDE